MSLIRQLWLTIIASTLIAFLGSFAISLVTARQYLEYQLAVKNNDNAASLALSMSQLDKDPVTTELQIAALFDSGQYSLVKLISPTGKTLMEKQGSGAVAKVPAWFIRLFPIESKPGYAQVSAGWKQFGTVEVVSSTQFAYGELWRGGVKLAYLFFFSGLVVGLLGTALLKRIKGPLHAVVEQAKAIGQRNFIHLPLPKVPELRTVVKALNAMVGSLQTLFNEQAKHLDELRRENLLDKLTGLANRENFLDQLNNVLGGQEDLPPTGSLVLLRITNLLDINRHHGREATDDLLRQVGTALSTTARDQHGAAARLNGSDFILLLPSQEDPEGAVKQLMGALQALGDTGWKDISGTWHLSSCPYLQGQSASHLLARLDQALATAEWQQDEVWRRADNPIDLPLTNHGEWKALIEAALRDKRAKLAEYPVQAFAGGQLLHLECPLRLGAPNGEDWLVAGKFMPMAVRLGLTDQLDLLTLQLVLERLTEESPAMAINLSGESLRSPQFQDQFYKTLANHKTLAPRLWIEISETGAFENFLDFLAFCHLIRPLGCHLGIEHFGHRFSNIGQLYQTGLEYIKVDGSFIQELDNKPGNQIFLKGLCGIAHGIGLQVIGENTRTPAEMDWLEKLGFDGVTGPVLA